MNRSLRVLASAAALTLAGCSSVPLTSMPPLARIDAKTTDLSMLRVAVQLPDALRPRSGGVKLDVVTKLAGEAETKMSFAMMEISARARACRSLHRAPRYMPIDCRRKMPRVSRRCAPR